MEDIIFLKYTNNIGGSNRGEGINGNYYLGALFCMNKEDYDTRRLDINLDIRVLTNCHPQGLDCFDIMFCVVFNELTVVNNDQDLNECIELYGRTYGGTNSERTTDSSTAFPW